MLPEKIRNFVLELTKRTENGQLSWVYDDETESVFLQEPQFNVTLRYSFNELEECGEFVLLYFDHTRGKDYRFYTNQRFTDYDSVRRLFDSAQSSGLNLPF